jgi:hypothetical protein
MFYVRTSRILSALGVPSGGDILFAPLLAGIPSIGGGAFLRPGAIVFDTQIAGAAALAARSRAIEKEIAAPLEGALTKLLPGPVGPLVDRLVGGGDLADDQEATARARAELGPGYSIKGFVDRHHLLPVVRWIRHGETDLPLPYVVYGTRSDHDTLFARLVIGVD